MKLLTIITRFSRRDRFPECFRSLQYQPGLEQIEHLVTCQTDEDEKYLRKFDGITILRVPKIDLNRYGHNRPEEYPDVVGARRFAPYNFHLTIAANACTTPWFGFLDDDDLMKQDRLIKLLWFLQKVPEHQWVLSQVELLHGQPAQAKLIPSDDDFRLLARQQKMAWCAVDGHGFWLRNEHKRYMAYGELSGGDFDTGIELVKAEQRFVPYPHGPIVQHRALGHGSSQVMGLAQSEWANQKK
jgi:hypothetical protein